MTNNPRPYPVDHEDRELARAEAEASAAAEATTTQEGGVHGAGSNEPGLVATLEAEKADLKDRLMRSLADMENVRRRAEREASETRLYAVTGFARDMLTVADNIRRALDSMPKEGPSFEAAKPLIEGIELTERDLVSTLSRHGVKLLDPQGQKFDPNMHQAMFEVPNDELPNGTVVQVIQSGYAIGERVLRPALVGVSKPTPRPAKATGPEGAAGATD